LNAKGAVFHRICDKEITLHPAGHILGSTQLEYTNGHTIVFTGDMKLREGFTSERADIIKCDELHIDCTFGTPEFEFDSKEIIADRIDRWTRTRLMTGNSVIFGAYPVGKAQELIYILNEYSSIIPVVDSSIEEKCRVYEKYGIKLERIEIGTKEASEVMRDKFVYIIPFNFVNQESEKWFRTQYKQVSFSLLTGWAKRYKYRYHAFPLSDHAGFSEILKYVEESGAKEIICKYGNAAYMVSYLRSKGYNAIIDKEWEYKNRKILDSVAVSLSNK
ncbi:MAG: MBL fold metallo-hydrolase, partial [Candidatus Micrarchaeota archaeon]|nr:MBL fold metallo-hydrolase [Candidatus Micrarchaeota archaeon]